MAEFLVSTPVRGSRALCWSVPKSPLGQAGIRRSAKQGRRGREGWTDLSVEDEKDRDRRRKSSQAGGRSAGKRPGPPEFGQALRSVYQKTINEDIPPEMLDLLGKLG